MGHHPNWLFDESVQVGVDYANEDRVADYDTHHEGFRDFDREAKKISAALGLSTDSTILDMGCGTGGLAIRLAQACKHVYAVDISETMLAALEQKIQTRGLCNITTIQSGFLSYEHQGEALDAIVANITLHHLPDFWKQIALCKLFDILTTGGRLFLADVVFGFDPRAYQKNIEEWLANMADLAGQNMADETVIHVREEFSTWEWVIEGMLERAGFRIDSSFDIMKHLRAYVCSK